MKLLVNREGPFATVLLKHPTWWMFFSTRNDDCAFSSSKPGNKPCRAAYILTQINSKYSIHPLHVPWFKTKNQIDNDTDPKKISIRSQDKVQPWDQTKKALVVAGFNCDLRVFPMMALYPRGDRIQPGTLFHWLTRISFPSTSPLVLENAGLLHRPPLFIRISPDEILFPLSFRLCVAYKRNRKLRVTQWIFT